MRQIWAAAWLVTSLLVGQTTPADQAQKEEAAKNKAEVLEEKAAAEGGTVLPSAAIITKPEAQAVDPIGEESLDGAVTCLARTIYWEARAKVMEHGSLANVVMNRIGHKGFPNTDLWSRQARPRAGCLPVLLVV